MKALVISHAHPAFSIGGAQVASWNLFEGLRRAPGWGAHYLAGVGAPTPPHPEGPLMSLGRGADETLYWSQDYDWLHLATEDLGALMGHFERFLRDCRPDLVNFHHVMGFGAQALRATRRALGDTPIVFTLHEYLPICANHGQMLKTATGALCRRASPTDCGACFPEHGPAGMLRRELYLKSFLAEVDAFVSPSRFLLDRYADWGLPRARLTMIENGFDGGGPPVPARRLSAGGRRDRFAFFGQMNPFKGVKVLVEAVGRVPAAVWGDATLTIHGGNLELQPEAFQREMRELLERARARIRFAGPYKSPDLPRLMADADWVVVPSTWWENAPVVIQEAQFHGRPVIASDIGGMAEKVADGVDGLHFRAGVPDALAATLARCLTERGLWEGLVRGVRPPPTADEAAARHVALFERLLARRGRAQAAAPGRAAAAEIEA